MPGENYDQAYHMHERSFQDSSPLKVPDPPLQHDRNERQGPRGKTATGRNFASWDSEGSRTNHLQTSTRPKPPAQDGIRNSELPPTPPSAIKDAQAPANGPSPHLINGMLAPFPAYKSGVSTPVYQRSPPTPDLTPPSSRDIMSAPQTPPPRSYLSSRAESFKTARDNVYTSDGATSPDSPMVRTQSTEDWLASTRIARLRRMGLVSDVVAAQSNTGPMQAEISRHRHTTNHESDNAIPNGETLDDHTVSDRESDTNVMRNVAVHGKRPMSTMQDAAKQSGGSQRDTAVPQLWRGLSLQGLVGLDKQCPDAVSVGRLMERPGSPSTTNDTPQTHHRAIDSEPLSGIATTSDTIQAIILEAPLERRRTLRHAGKNLALRSSRDGGSPDCSSQSSGATTYHRLRHKGSDLVDHRSRDAKGRDLLGDVPDLSDQRHDHSSLATFNQGATATATLDHLSLYSVAQQESLHHPKGVQDDPPTASGRDAGQAIAIAGPRSNEDQGVELCQDQAEDRIHQSVYTKDDGNIFVTPAASPHSGRLSSNQTNEFFDAKSTISNYTTASKLRQAALEADASLNNEQYPQRMNIDRSTIFSDDDPYVGQSIIHSGGPARRSLDHAATRGHDHAMARRFYAQASPMSQIDCGEALEVSEATAVSIYPHKNDSVLVVQQIAPPNSRRQTQLEVPTTPPILTIEPSSQTIGIRTTARVESPLKNPRKPPDPPSLKIIPPSPAEELDRQLVSRSSTAGERKHLPVRRTSLVQRARRYSDSLIQPLLRTSSIRRTPGKYHRPSRATEQGGNLHPFWRPRGFWDDFSSDEEDVVEDRLPSGGDTTEVWKSGRLSGLGGFLIGNSLGFERQASNHRRHRISLPPSFRNRQREHSRSTEASTGTEAKFSTTQRAVATKLEANRSTSSVWSLGTSRSWKYGRRKRVRFIPGLGMQVEYIGLRGLIHRLKEARMRREEKGREKNRQRLRKSIGPRWIVE